MLLPNGADRKQFIDYMRAAGVQTSIHYPPIHRFSYYNQWYPDLCLPRTEDISRREVTLPLYPTMSTDDIEVVVSAVRSALERIRHTQARA